MKLLDCRRLTGPNLIWSRAGSIADVECEPQDIEPLMNLWQNNVTYALAQIGWSHEQTNSHRFPYGVSLALSAPIDALYTATELNEWAVNAAIQTLDTGTEPVDRDETMIRLRSELDQEVNPGLLRLEQQAKEKNAPFLSDDDEVSLGFGVTSETWPVGQLPAPSDLIWSSFERIPVGLVTGTNGKTTTVRLAVKIARTAGRNVGLSSTDWVGVNDRVIDRGDYSGPGGARTVLRDKAVDIAILETARGGLLRRGLGVERADAALITNIAEDHLGDFGSRSIDELLDVKWVVGSVIDSEGVLILNAEDSRLVAKSSQASCPLAWFSVEQNNSVIQKARETGQRVATVQDGNFVILDQGEKIDLCSVDQVPVTINGLARHNVSNALAAALLSYSLGIEPEFIAQGLKATQLSDNPGRCNLFKVNGATVLVDFAHNPEGLQALFHLASQLPGKRRLLCFAQAGDRTDESIQELAGVAWQIGLDRVHISELEKYARGRAYKEVFGLLKSELMHRGAQEQQIQHFELELDALKAAVEWAEPDDLIIMLALASGDEIVSWLKDHSISST